jgi:hypothetical protein
MRVNGMQEFVIALSYSRNKWKPSEWSEHESKTGPQPREYSQEVHPPLRSVPSCWLGFVLEPVKVMSFCFWVLPSSERKSVSLGSPRLRTFALLIRPPLNIEISLEHDPDWGNRSTCRKTCSCVTLSTTNPTWTDLGSKPVIRGDRPTTSRPLRSLTSI